MSWTKTDEVTTPSWDGTTEVTTPVWVRTSDGYKLLTELSGGLQQETECYLLNESSISDIWTASTEVTTPSWSVTAEVTTPTWAGASGWFWENKSINWESETHNWEEAG